MTKARMAKLVACWLADPGIQVQTPPGQIILNQIVEHSGDLEA